MDKSFRTILNEYLETPSAAPAADFPSFTHSFEQTFFDFTIARPNRRATTGARPYARETALSRARGEHLRKPRPEPLVTSERLSAGDRADVTWLINAGANDLAEGVSIKRLKSAYRRLARRYHPDVDPTPQSHETFLEVQTRYRRLLARLPQYQTCSSR